MKILEFTFGIRENQITENVEPSAEHEELPAVEEQQEPPAEEAL